MSYPGRPTPTLSDIASAVTRIYTTLREHVGKDAPREDCPVCFSPELFLIEGRCPLCVCQGLRRD